MGIAQAVRLPGTHRRQFRDPLRERTPWTPWIATEESPHPHVQLHWHALRRQVRQRAVIAAVHAMRRLMALRTAGGCRRSTQVDDDLPRLDRDLLAGQGFHAR